MFRYFSNFIVFLALTIVTQIGGIAWLLSRPLTYKFAAFLGIYTALTVATMFVAPVFGRQAIPCGNDGPLQVQSWFYCITNRTYVSPELEDVLQDLARDINEKHPGTVTMILDGNFPFLDGFPLLPHLSHDDGDKVDLAFFYKSENGYLPGQARSPIGYFAFEQGPTECPKAWPTLRWDFKAVQPIWRDYELDDARNRSALKLLVKDTRITKVLIEPHLVERLDVEGDKIRFQGCRAARHDDHIHIQL